MMSAVQTEKSEGDDKKLEQKLHESEIKEKGVAPIPKLSASSPYVEEAKHSEERQELIKADSNSK